jgi:hypothetical protein
MEVGQPVAATAKKALEVPQALRGGRLQSQIAPAARIAATSRA